MLHKCIAILAVLFTFTVSGCVLDRVSVQLNTQQNEAGETEVSLGVTSEDVDVNVSGTIE